MSLLLDRNEDAALLAKDRREIGQYCPLAAEGFFDGAPCQTNYRSAFFGSRSKWKSKTSIPTSLHNDIVGKTSTKG